MRPIARDLVTATEAARVLGVSRVTVWRMARAGELPLAEQTHGGDARAGRVRFRRADLDAIVAGRDPIAA